jgi:transcriptional regulator with XRE-family HTH domain
MADGSDSLEDIGRRIRDLREAMGYDKASLFAEFMDWSPQQLWNYETGQKRPKVSVAIQLCRKTHVTLDWIYRGEPAGLPLEMANLIQDYLDRQRNADR